MPFPYKGFPGTSLVGMGVSILNRAGYQFRCLDSILDILITFSEYSFNTKAIDISKK